MNKSPNAHGEFICIQEAYNTLKDPQKRKAYNYQIKSIQTKSTQTKSTQTTSKQRPQEEYDEDILRKAREDKINYSKKVLIPWLFLMFSGSITLIVVVIYFA